jgi:hypothetical protein
MYIFYFFFNRFAIIWIPLVLLVIFNTILIFYVHRSKQNELRNSDGIKLRRHNRGSQGEQRKTTIMLSKFVQRKILSSKNKLRFQLQLLLYLLFVKFLKPYL